MKDYLRAILGTMLLMVSITVDAECQYCYTYEDFIEGKWEKLDTIIISSNSKKKRTLSNGNLYELSTGDKAIDKKLTKNIFAVMKDDTLYINCYNLRCENISINERYDKNTYVIAKRIGQRSLLFVGGMVDTSATDKAISMGIMFGAVGGVIASASTDAIMSHKVCYVISGGADAKGRINTRMIDDGMIDQMMIGQNELRYEYYSEEDAEKRMGAKNVISYLKKAGLFKQTSQQPSTPQPEPPVPAPKTERNVN
jgi:hypothetical protein